MAGAWEVRRFTVTSFQRFYTPDSPQVTDIVFPVRQVQRIRIRIPPGPSGLMGFALTMGGAPVLPYESGTYFIADNEVIDLGVEDLPTTGAWQVSSYNLGLYPHTIYLDFTVSLPDLPSSSSSFQPLSPALITPTAAQITALNT